MCCDYLIQDYLHRKSLRAIDVTYWTPRDNAHEPSPLKFVTRKFKRRTLTGGIDDKIILDEAPAAIRELIHQSDTRLGIEFTFAKTAKYASLVKLFEICRTENVPVYMHYHNKFWVFNIKRDASPVTSRRMKNVDYYQQQHPSEEE